MKKLIVFALIALMFFTISCKNQNIENSQSDESFQTTSSDQSSEPVVQTEINIKFGDTLLKADSVNSAIPDGISVYDRNFVIDNIPQLYVPACDKDSIVVTVNYNLVRNTKDFSINQVYGNNDNKNRIVIPINGFAVIIPRSSVDNDFKVKVSTSVSVSEWDSPEYENLRLATVMPSDRNTSRRINMLLPDGKELNETDKAALLKTNMIYYITKKDKLTLPNDSIAVLINGNSSVKTVIGTAKAGTLLENQTALLFTGSYNVRYAEEFYNEGKLTFLNADLLNSYSDFPSLKYSRENNNGSKDEVIYSFENKTNVAAEGDGIFLFTTDNERMITLCNGDFRNIVVVNGKVCYVGDENRNTLIPTSHGYVLSFCGSCKDESDNFSLGDKVEAFLIEDYSNPNRFVRLNGHEYEIFGLNTDLSAEKPVVLYTGIASTEQTNCTEIAFVKDTVTEISKEGNMVVPEGGYVLSVLNGQTKYINRLKKLSVNDKAEISYAGNSYGYTEFKFNTVNGVRFTDSIIVYDGKQGSATGTNQYGFEFAVNSEGKITESSYTGNMTIPKNGFVVSAHGNSVETLENVFKKGATVRYNNKTKTVSVFTTPELDLYAADCKLKEQSDKYDIAKDNFDSLDYKSLDIEFNRLKQTLSVAKSDYDNGNIDSAVISANSVLAVLNSLQYRIYESLPIENRSVWYRANEKSDDEVLSSVKLMSEMGINAIYIETWYNGSVIGFSENKLIPHNSSAHSNYDALAGFCKYAHEYGIEVHVWVENFFIGGPETSLSKATVGHHLVDKQGRDKAPTPSYGDFVFLNPFDKYSQDLVMGVYKEIVQKYDIDGIHLDYIRFPEPNMYDGADFGYNDDIINAFKKEYNTDLDPRTFTTTSSLWSKWCLFREDIINDWVKQVYDMVQELKPKLNISCAVANNYPQSKTTIFQNFVNWVENGWMDEVFSMSYCSDLITPINNIRTFMSYTKEKCLYSIGLSAFESSPDYILVGQIQVARDNGAFGSNLFSWGSLVKHSENYFDAIKTNIWCSEAVRVDKGSKTVSAYCQWLLSDIENVYSFLAPLDNGFYAVIKEKTNEIKQKANSVDFDSLSKDAKQQYISDALIDLNELKELFKTSGNSKIQKAMTDDLNYVIKCLKHTH